MKYEKSGKPVSGETVVFSVTKTSGLDNFEVKGSSSAITNSNGIASFVIGPKTAIRANESGKTAAYKYTATIASTGAKCTGEVAFARVYLNNVVNVNGVTGKAHAALAKSKNDTATGSDGLALTRGTRSEQNDGNFEYNPNWVEYVASQQVSTTSVDHAVEFEGAYPYISIPATASDFDAAKSFVQEVNLSSDKYHVYAGAGDAKYITLDVKPQELTYATLNFTSLNLSKYTKLVIEEYNNEADAKDSKNIIRPATTIEGAANQTSFSYQIGLNATDGLVLKVYIVSQGQVDTKNNNGYVIKDITGNYKTQSTTNLSAPLKNASVKWEIVTPSYSEIRELNTADFKANTGVDLTSYAKVTYQVPVFPFTGNAVLTCYDANNKVKAYYACPTSNNSKNVNVLNTAEKDIYEISEEEANNHNVGEIVSQSANSVVVDSQKSGTTNLKGVITVDGVILEGLDENSKYAYTSVQWNPVEKAASTNDAFLALAGQYIDVVAQLVDKNGNAVASQNENVTFKYTNGSTATTINTTDTSVNAYGSGSVAVVSVDAKTNVKGQAILRLKAADVKTLIGVCAESANSKFDVVLKLADKTTEKADLYWVDANLNFTDTAVGAATTTSTSKDAPFATVSSGIGDITGSTWEYGVYTTSDKLVGGALDGKSVSINNLGIIMKKDADAVGTVTFDNERKGVANATSTKTGYAKIISRIDSTCITDGVTFTVGGNEVACVGKGSTNIERQLNLNVKWTNNGMTAEFVNANGTYVNYMNTGSTKDVYVKVCDTNGNPMNGKTVTFSVDDTTNATLSSTTATTDANGIAKVILTANASKRYVVSAKVTGLEDEVASQPYTFIPADKDFALDTGLNVDGSAYKSTVSGSSIVLCMTDEIDKNSVNADQFAASYNGKELAITSVNVDGKYAILNVKNANFDDVAKPIVVTASSVTVNSVAYNLTSVQGVALQNNTTFTVWAKKAAPSQDRASAFSGYAAAVATTQAIVAKLELAVAAPTSGAVIFNTDGINVSMAAITGESDVTVTSTCAVTKKCLVDNGSISSRGDLANFTYATGLTAADAGAVTEITLTFKHASYNGIAIKKTLIVKYDGTKITAELKN